MSGKAIFETHMVNTTNFFSYSYPQFPFINNVWLSQIIFFILVKYIGFTGLLFCTSILAALSILLIFKIYTAKHKLSFTALLLSLMLFIIPLAHRTDIRPEILSFLFTSLFMYILYRNKEASTKLLYLLPIIEVLWVNIHIYFPIGIILMGIFLFEEVIKRFHETKINISKHIIKIFTNTTTSRLGFVFFLTLFATLFNPNGITGALFPFTFSQNYIYAPQETYSIFYFLQNTGFIVRLTLITFALACLFTLICFISNRKKTSLSDWLLLMIFSYLGISHVRMLPIFRLVLLVPFLINSNLFFDKASRLFPKAKTALTHMFSVTILLILCVWEVGHIYYFQGIGSNTTPYAKNASDFFVSHNIQGPIFNNITLGSYLEYRIYPRNRVFVDTRPEAYPNSFFTKEYIPMQQHADVFKRMEDRYHFTTIIFNYTDAYPWAITFVHQILQNPSWKLVYVDEYAMILLKEIPNNHSIITTFAMDPHHFTPGVNQNDPSSLIHIIGFLERAGWVDEELTWLRMYITINPHDCLALQRISQITLDKKLDQENQLYIQNYQQFCAN